MYARFEGKARAMLGGLRSVVELVGLFGGKDGYRGVVREIEGAVYAEPA